MKKIILSIEGMTCSACSNGLEKYLNKQDGIKQASVNLVMANASIEYDEKKLDIDKLNEFVKKAGFKSLGEFKEIKTESKSKKEKVKFIIFTILAIIFMYISMGHMINLPTLKIIDVNQNPIGYTICLLRFAILFIVYGFDIGADDYVIKPFRNRELISRINNVLRRNNKGKQIKYKDITIDVDSGRVYKNEQEVLLTKLEYTILLCLFQNQNILISREKLLNDIWDAAGNFVEDNTLTVYIKRIREKIGDSNGNIIKTIRGMGYRVGD